jgi:protease I
MGHGDLNLACQPDCVWRDRPAQKKIVADCHAPWLLIASGIAKGRKMTSYKSIKTDVMSAGANWEDSEVVVGEGIITLHNPGDLAAFGKKGIEEVKVKRSAAWQKAADEWDGSPRPS